MYCASRWLGYTRREKAVTRMTRVGTLTAVGGAASTDRRAPQLRGNVASASSLALRACPLSALLKTGRRRAGDTDAAGPHGTPKWPRLSRLEMRRACSNMEPPAGYANSVCIAVCRSGAEILATDSSDREASGPSERGPGKAVRVCSGVGVLARARRRTRRGMLRALYHFHFYHQKCRLSER
jgi:hypothetical protein